MPTWRESQHPRDKDGQFSSGSSTGEYGEHGRGGQREYESGYASKPKEPKLQYYGWSTPARSVHRDDKRKLQLDACLDSLKDLQRRMDAVEQRLDAEWQEHQHPRENDGKFAPKGGGGGGVASGTEAAETSHQPFAKHGATTLFAQYSVPSYDHFIKTLAPHERRIVERVEQKLRNSVSTDAPVDKGGHRQPNGQFTQERQQLHSKIIRSILSPEKVKEAKPAAGQKPTFAVLGGRAGSGKSFVTKGGPVNPNKAIVIDSDMIKAQLPEYKGWNAALCHEEASHIAEHAIAMARKLKLNVVLDGTMRTASSMQLRLEAFKDAGYRLEGYYVFAPPHVAAKRAVGRAMGATGRYVSPGYVLSSTTNEKAFDDLREYFNKWEVYDNSGAKPEKKFAGGDD